MSILAGVATPPVWWELYPGPSSLWPALAWPPGHLDNSPKFQPPQAKLPVALAPVQVPNLQWGLPPPRRPLCLPLFLPLSAPPQASTPLTPVPHPSLEMTRCVYLVGVHWSCTPQGQPPLCTNARCALHNLGTSSSALSRHSTNLEVAGQGTTDTRKVYILASTCRQERELVSYSRS